MPKYVPYVEDDAPAPAPAPKGGRYRPYDDSGDAGSPAPATEGKGSGLLTSALETANEYVGGIARGAAPPIAAAALGGAGATVLLGPEMAPVGAAAGLAAGTLADVAMTGYNALAPRVGLPQGPTSQEAMDALLDRLGVARPQTPGARIAGMAAGGAAGGGLQALTASGLAGLLKPGLVQKIAEEAGKLPLTQTLASAGGGAGAQLAAEMGGGPAGQIAGGIAGSTLAGGVLPRLAGHKYPEIVPKTPPPDVQARQAAATEVGISKAPMGYAKPTTLSKAAEQAMSGTMAGREQRKRLSDEIGKYVQGIVKSVGTDVPPAKQRALAQRLHMARGSAPNPAAAEAHVDSALQALGIAAAPEQKQALTQAVLNAAAIQAAPAAEQAVRRDVQNALGRGIPASKANSIVTGLGKATNIDAAGKLLQKDLGGEGFLKRVRKVEKPLWDKWFATAEQGGGEMNLPNTIKYLNEVASRKGMPGAEKSSKLLQDPTLRRHFVAMRRDMGAKGATTMPVRFLKEFQSYIGDSLDPKRLTARDVSVKDYKGLYAALYDDFEAHARGIGPHALRDFKRAKMATRGRIDRIDTFLQEIQSHQPQAAYKYAAAPESVEGGGHRFLAINRSLSPEARDVFHATFINEMGRSPTGEFDPIRWADNYKKLAPQVRGALFSGERKKAAQAAETLIDGLREVGAIGPPAETARNLTTYLILSSLMHFNVKGLAVGLASMGKAEKVLDWVSKPAVANWLASQSRLTPREVGQWVTDTRTALHANKGAFKKPEDRQTYPSVDELLEGYVP